MGKPPTCIPRSVLLFLIPGSRTLCTGSSPIPIERARDSGAGVTAEHTSESCLQLCLCGAVGIEVSEPRVHVWMPKLTSRLPEALSFILLVILGKRPPHAHIVGTLQLTRSDPHCARLWTSGHPEKGGNMSGIDQIPPHPIFGSLLRATHPS